MLKPFRKSSSATTKLKGLHNDTAPESGQLCDSWKWQMKNIYNMEDVEYNGKT